MSIPFEQAMYIVTPLTLVLGAAFGWVASRTLLRAQGRSRRRPRRVPKMSSERLFAMFGAVPGPRYWQWPAGQRLANEQESQALAAFKARARRNRTPILD